MVDLRRLRRHERPIAAFHRFFKLLRCGPSLRRFVRSEAFFWLKRRSADKPELCRQGHCLRGNPSHLSQDLRCIALGVAKPAIGLRQETTGPNCTLTAYQSIKTRCFSRERVFRSTSMRTAIASPTLRSLTVPYPKCACTILETMEARLLRANFEVLWQRIVCHHRVCCAASFLKCRRSKIIIHVFSLKLKIGSKTRTSRVSSGRSI
jgi:hypothetical protein